MLRFSTGKLAFSIIKVLIISMSTTWAPLDLKHGTENTSWKKHKTLQGNAGNQAGGPGLGSWR